MPDIRQIVSFEELVELTGYNKPCDIRTALMNAGVTYLEGSRGKVYTTVDALNKAMGVHDKLPEIKENRTIEI